MSKNVFTKEWLEAALIRCIRTIAQAAIAAIGSSVYFHSVDWKLVVSTALLAGILSLLTSIPKTSPIFYLRKTCN